MLFYKNQILFNSYSLLIFILACLLSTHQQKARFNDIDISDFSFRDLALVTSEQKLYQKLGEPDTVFTLHGDLDQVRAFEKNDGSPMRVPSATLLYGKGVVYKLQHQKTYLEYLDFRQNPHARINHPDFTLNAATNLEDIRQYFPDSYQHINHGASLQRGFMSDEEAAGYKFITLIDKHEAHTWQIELGFINESLVSFRNLYIPKKR